MPLIRVAAVVLTDEHERVLTVRKRGTERFMLPGGKPEPGERFVETAVREVNEELGLELALADLEPLAHFMSAAANEPGHELESHVFTHVPMLTSTPQVAAEIEELRWFGADELRDPSVGVLLAPMLQFDAVPVIFGDALIGRVRAAYMAMHEQVHGRAPEQGERALSVVQYDAARRTYLQQRALAEETPGRSGAGAAQWPPTSQTVMKQLGDGAWADAMAALGLTTAVGRVRGASSIDEATYVETVRSFLESVADLDDADTATESFVHFTQWLAREKQAGRRRPSAAGVRRHYGSWEAAKLAARAEH